mmetsp:Transcript_41442/g.107368  ORF Transcript_41442/g.107368 Transcript_41442/m.107368 type:complete len:842 (-) Transcript_41442:30-2555(-)
MKAGEKKDAANMPVRIALCGAGRMGKKWAEFLSHSAGQCEVVAVIDSYEVGGRETASSVSPTACAWYPSLKCAFVEHGLEVDGVWIANRTVDHTPFILAAASLRPGVAIFSEKPLHGYSEGVRACYRATSAAGCFLGCGLQRVLDPSISHLMHTVHSGGIGSMYALHMIEHDHPLPSTAFLKNGGEIFDDLFCHGASVLLSVWRRFPTSVSACVMKGPSACKEAGVNGYASITLRTGNTNGSRCDDVEEEGVTTVQIGRYRAGGYDCRLEAHGDEGVVEVKNPTGTHSTAPSAGESGYADETKAGQKEGEEQEDSKKREVEVGVSRKRAGGGSTLPYDFAERFRTSFQLQAEKYVSILTYLNAMRREDMKRREKEGEIGEGVVMRSLYSARLQHDWHVQEDIVADAQRLCALARAASKSVEKEVLPSSPSSLRIACIGNGSFGKFIRHHVLLSPTSETGMQGGTGGQKEGKRGATHEEEEGKVGEEESRRHNSAKHDAYVPPQRWTVVDEVWTSKSNIEEELGRTSANAIYVCSPDHLHDEHVELALKHGKHVIVEKPLFRYDELRCMADEKGLVLMVNLHRRYDAQYSLAKGYAWGVQPTHIRIESYDPVPAQKEDTIHNVVDFRHVISNSVVHDLDMALWLLSASPDFYSCPPPPLSLPSSPPLSSPSALLSSSPPLPSPPSRPPVRCLADAITVEEVVPTPHAGVNVLLSAQVGGHGGTVGAETREERRRESMEGGDMGEEGRISVEICFKKCHSSYTQKVKMYEKKGGQQLAEFGYDFAAPPPTSDVHMCSGYEDAYRCVFLAFADAVERKLCVQHCSDTFTLMRKVWNHHTPHLDV